MMTCESSERLAFGTINDDSSEILFSRNSIASC